MNRCVPDFEMDEDSAIPASSSSGALIRPKKTALGEEEIMELLWQNGQVVLQSQNQRSFKKSTDGNGGEAEIPAHQQQQSTAREAPTSENENMPQHHHQQQQLFMQEDEMASWLHYPLDDSSFDRDLYSDLLYAPPSAPINTVTPFIPPRDIRTIVTEIRPLAPPPPAPSVAMPPRPPIHPPPSKRADAEASDRFQNFMHFSRLPKARIESGPHSWSKAAGELTVVDSNETPTIGPESRISQAADSTAQVSRGNVGCGAMSCIPAPATSTAPRDLTPACELTVSSSPGGSGASVSASAEPPPTNHKPSTSTADDRKRKGREPDETDCQSEDVEFESADVKKQARGSTSTKRSRAAEVHNLSERRRRDRINEKMRALQELIPRCNKSDKASMLDEAIEYLKSLQLQVQMMSMGYGMLPLMYPGGQQYMPAMGMGMGIGMGMGMELGMNRPMMPYPSLLPGSGMPAAAVGANMGPRFPVPAFHMQPVPLADSSRIQATDPLDPMLTSIVTQNPNQPRMPNFADPYQQFIGLHQAQVPLPQNHVVVQPNKPNSSREVGHPENHQSG